MALCLLNCCNPIPKVAERCKDIQSDKRLPKYTNSKYGLILARNQGMEQYYNILFLKDKLEVYN